jgi:hypothetical protein
MKDGEEAKHNNLAHFFGMQIHKNQQCILLERKLLIVLYENWYLLYTIVVHVG